MPKITYLLGAGASADALPTIASSPDGSGRGLSQKLCDYSDTFYQNGDYEEMLRFKEIPLKDLAINSRTFKTPDLYAKYLLETSDYLNYNRLKLLISHYFNNAQYPYTKNVNPAFDFRALQFLITLTNDKKLPDNIKLISWNYDSQIEIAANRLHLDHDKGFASWPNIPTTTYDKEIFLLHLNGVAGFQYSKKDFRTEIEKKFSLDNTIQPLLSFAWEDDSLGMHNFINYRIKYLEELIKGTDILVVIGYSFPFFNRKIDNIIMQAMKINPRKKIYYQDPYRSGDFLYDQFGLDQGITIKHIDDCNQYFIPYEL